MADAMKGATRVHSLVSPLIASSHNYAGYGIYESRSQFAPDTKDHARL